MKPDVNLAAGREPPRLALLWLEITARCNLECGHCYAESGPHQPARGHMTTAAWLDVLREAADMRCEAVQFIGGEPTLHPDLHAMIAAARRLGLRRIELFTNATRVDGALIERLVADHVEVAFSFYAADAGVHDAVTGRPGSFARTVAGIRRLIDAHVPVRAGVIETEANVGHAPEALRLLSALGVERASVDVQREVGRGMRALRPSPETELSALCGRCGHGRLCVTPSGDIHPCVFARSAPVGRVDRGLRDALESPALTDFLVRLDRGRCPEGATAPASDGATTIPCLPDHCIPTCNPGVFDPSPKCMPGGADCAPIGHRTRTLAVSDSRC